jgi:AraC-like DNA-binding protein
MTAQPMSGINLIPYDQLELWRASEGRYFWAMDMDLADDPHFHAAIHARQIGDVTIGGFSTSIRSGTRKAAHVALDGKDCVSLSINTGLMPHLTRTRGRECILEPGAAVLLSGSEPFSLASTGAASCFQIVVPRSQLSPHIEDRLGYRVDASIAALSTLHEYCNILGHLEPLPSPGVMAIASSAIVELLSAVMESSGEQKNMRGLRAARLASILDRIRRNFSRADFSVNAVARELSVSPRYVQDLLAESGHTFAERVLELRLRQVHSQLADPHFDNQRISQIAYAAGFSDISYFNRCFRRRFGTTPKAMR